nr:hypothetical protein [Tanacetum cinerariifolium]
MTPQSSLSAIGEGMTRQDHSDVSNQVDVTLQDGRSFQ